MVPLRIASPSWTLVRQGCDFPFVVCMLRAPELPGFGVVLETVITGWKGVLLEEQEEGYLSGNS